MSKALAGSAPWLSDHVAARIAALPHVAPLPVDAILEPLIAALDAQSAAVLMAPPGAGKTTRVPLALLSQRWLGNNKILVLEPRRLAARGAAERMASLLGEPLGQTIGLRARFITASSPQTRVEVITEGVFTRMIIDDPTLDGVGAVLFDEFHERSLDVDLGLALALDAQAGLRPDLRLLVMSATLDGARVKKLLENASRNVALLQSEGRAYPVETHYVARDSTKPLEPQVRDVIVRAMQTCDGSLLAFLPGQGEIRKVAELVASSIGDPDIDIVPLFGAMDPAAQDRAVRPREDGRRKIVLATSIAETSLTIDGVRIVVDCGLSRVPRYEPDVGMTRLATVRVSQASADQRRGRAGRTQPGVCYRLWQKSQTASLAPFAEPEIVSADLTGLVLDCAAWGVIDVRALAWLDPPPVAALDAARIQLRLLDAIDERGALTPIGRNVRGFALPPRLAVMVMRAAATGHAQAAAEIAAVLVERGIGGNDSDLDHRLAVFRRDRSRRAQDMRALARRWARQAKDDLASGESAGEPGGEPGCDRREIPSAALLALAFPDRIAKARGLPGQFLLANGRAAALDPADPLLSSSYLVVAELAGTAARTRILLAARVSAEAFEALSASRIVETTEIAFDTNAFAVRARRVRRLDAIVVSSAPCAIVPDHATARLLALGIAQAGIDRLPWTNAQQQVRARVAFLANAATAPTASSPWPDLTDAGLAASAAHWLAQAVASKTALAEIDAGDLEAGLDSLIPWDLKRRLDAEAPTHYEAPTGHRHAIDYEGAGAPALHIKVQELFSLNEHPTIARKTLPLTLYLLSPALRPIQITKDLPGFWRGSWTAVKSEMRGRYPRHVWPDDPAHAQPTVRAKPRA